MDVTSKQPDPSDAFRAFADVAHNTPEAAAAACPVFLVQLRLRDLKGEDYLPDGPRSRRASQASAHVELLNTRREPGDGIQESLQLMQLYLPNQLLGRIAYEAGLGRIVEVRFKPRASLEEGGACTLALSLALPSGKPNSASNRPSGGLAPWQQRRVLEWINSSIKTDISMALLAVKCGVSTRHFSRAFHQSFGMPPHQYLLKKRVEHAQHLLSASALSLSAIAAECGFASHSHFSKVFTAASGMSPGQWRRLKFFNP